jgi:coenzyme F420-reducing hydrogenase delta subunit
MGSADLHPAVHGRGCKQPGRSRFGSLKTKFNVIFGTSSRKTVVVVGCHCFPCKYYNAEYKNKRKNSITEKVESN